MTHKYNARKTVRNGLVFDSKAEADYYNHLTLQERVGAIQMLQRQITFTLIDSFKRGKRKITSTEYTPDFGFIEEGKQVVVDVKGISTPDYLLKRKMFLLKYPDIVFREVKRDGSRWASKEWG